MGVHLTDLFLSMLGPVEAVVAQTAQRSLVEERKAKIFGEVGNLGHPGCQKRAERRSVAELANSVACGECRRPSPTVDQHNIRVSFSKCLATLHTETGSCANPCSQRIRLDPIADPVISVQWL